ncbi:MAG: class I tRNA ligase family protein, partial [Candidatus Wildermuthbacteria bacterium]|nr:class I tRNA ligase family protein [Candidatus Wildermuthbacteria bacterium]
KEGRSRFSMEPKDLYKEIWDFTQENKKNIKDQAKKMGASCDWSREKFTLDPDIVKTVYNTFQKLYDDDLVYRGRKIINWCPKHQTSLSDLETVDMEQNDKFYYLKYGPFIIATARPETKFGDKYVVIHPDDKRYQEYKQGQKIELEWINGKVVATVIKDKAIDMDFGTGVMTITPWHDAVDFDIAQRHGLDKEQIIDERGRLLPIAGEFTGMKILEARPKIIEKLQAKGLVAKIEENYKRVVKTCYKCGSLIEPQIKNQWFVKMKPLAEPAAKAIKDNKIKFIPAHYKKISLHWLKNIIDWNISRQIVWGIPIPAWFCGGPAKAAQLKMGFAGDVAIQVFKGKTKTYRLRDHGFKIGDKVIFENSETRTLFGYGIITQVEKTTVNKIDYSDPTHYKTYNNLKELLQALKLKNPEKDFNSKSPAYLYAYEFHSFNENDKKDGCGQIIISDGKPDKCPACGGENLKKETDTFDTWFSSGQWPFATLRACRPKDFETFYPTDVMETAGEIIFFWVARMIMLGLYATGEVPFKNVYLHGLVLDAKGQKMSKSRGNVINPLDLTLKYGTDAFRIGLVAGNTPGTSLALDENRIRGYRNFANKIWNAARFVLLQTETRGSQTSTSLLKSDFNTLKNLKKLTKDITKLMDDFKFYMAAEKIYHYFWHTFCDKIIEDCKNGKVSKYALLEILETNLKLLHPFMPFITEEIYQKLPIKNKKEYLMIESWPT